MSHPIRALLLGIMLLPAARAVAAQSLSPTLPSDTLEANYAPRRGVGVPTGKLSPTLPGDTLEATQPVDSFPTNPDSESATDTLGPSRSSSSQATPDSIMIRDLNEWFRQHPLIVAPPPVRAVLVRS